MQLPASALAASKITLKSGAAAPSTIYALHSYPLKVAGTSVKWVSSNKNIATIGQATGKLKPVAPGQVKITAKSINTGKAVATKTFKVLLRATDVSVSPSELTLSVGETATLATTLTPSNSTDVVRFYSDDKDIATVGLSSGKVTGKKAGETTITVYAKATKATANSSKYNKIAKVKVTVTEAKPVPTPTPNLTGVFGGLRASVSTTAATILNEGESFSVDITPVDKAGNPMSMGDMTVNPRLVVGGNATLNTGSFNVNETLSGGGASIRVIPTSTGYRIDVTGGSERCVYIVVLSVPHPTEPRNGNIASVRVAFQMTGKPIPKPTHTLTALDGFGNVLFTQTNEEGAALRLSAPTLDGYTFTGWTFATAIGTDLGQLAIMPACDVTATAQWTPIVTPEPVYTLYMDSGYEGGTLRTELVLVVNTGHSGTT